MSDRKNFSKHREQKLYDIVHQALTDIRIDILRGGYSNLSTCGMEKRFEANTRALGDKVCAEYRKSYAVTKRKEHVE